MNDKGGVLGVLGRTLELVVYDDGSDPATAIRLLRCQVRRLPDSRAIRRAGSLDSANIRDAILKMDHNTVYGGFRVDRDGVQIGHKMVMFQWHDGKKVIVWPEELAAEKRFPTPPWSQRQ